MIRVQPRKAVQTVVHALHLREAVGPLGLGLAVVEAAECLPELVAAGPGHHGRHARTRPVDCAVF